MSSIMRRRNGLIAWSVMGRLLSGVRVATPHLQTGRASYLSPHRAIGGGALPRERFSPLALFGLGAMSDLSPLCAPKRTPATHYESMSSHPGCGDGWSGTDKVFGPV